MVKIRRSLNHNNKNYFGKNNKKMFITIHDTGNPSKGANAQNHRSYIENGSTETWHYTVDDHEAIQHFSHDTQCWHAGDGRRNGNLNSIGIEMCVNSDGDYTKTVKNTVELVQLLMNELNISIENVKQHNYWSGKDCPRQLRNGKNGITWNKFLNLIQNTKTIEKGESKMYKVQTGAFTDKKNAEKLAKKLKADGYDTYIIFEGSTPELNKQKTVKQLADEVLKGKHGNGEQRKKSLGSRYSEVQNYINKMY